MPCMSKAIFRTSLEFPVVKKKSGESFRSSSASAGIKHVTYGVKGCTEYVGANNPLIQIRSDPSRYCRVSFNCVTPKVWPDLSPLRVRSEIQRPTPFTPNLNGTPLTFVAAFAISALPLS